MSDPLPQKNFIDDLQKRLDELAQELDKDFAREMAGLYLQDAPLQLQIVADAVAKKDSVLLAQAAHKLKGSSLNIGASRMASLCLHLEQLGKSGANIGDEPSLDELLKEFEQVKVFLLAYQSAV